MREIINLQLGQCGNNIGAQFLKRITLQHGINAQGNFVGTCDMQRERINVYFNEIAENAYNARTILADLQAGTIDNLRGSSIGNLYNCDNFVVGMGSAGNNWAVGYYGKGKDLIEILIDSVHKQAESCDSLQGFQMFHSICGGTGSGFGSLVLQRLHQEYENRMFQTFTLFPSLNNPSHITQTYNSVFSLLTLNEKVNMSHPLQNQALETLCLNKKKIKKPTFGNLNEIVSLAASDITCGVRFPGQLNASLRKMAMSLIPFRNLTFLVTSVAPLQKQKGELTTKQILGELMNKKSFLITPQSILNKYMTGHSIFRGKISTYELEHFLVKRQETNYGFVQFIPNCLQYSLCDYPPPDREVSATLIGNNNAVKPMFQRMSQNFSRAFKSRAFVHWYRDEGVDEMQFMEHQSKIRNLVADYTWDNDYEEGDSEF